ncbi:MAG: hypothetical protein AAGB22_09195, partial [Bacteroidota bacterium]
DAVHLKTRYEFAGATDRFYQDQSCPANSYKGYITHNIGVPEKVVVGVGEPDSLVTRYAYHPDYSIDSIVNPNGMVLRYDYDDFGRLSVAYRNGQRVSANQYATWANDTTLGFAARAAQNYVQASLFTNDGDLAAESSRAWLDPQGRAWNTASAVVPDGLNPTNPTAMVHSGRAVYDAWNRVVKQYKPFLHASGGTPVAWEPRLTTTDPVTYPAAFSAVAYENDQRARPLTEAKPGEDLATGHTVDFGYRFVNALCMLCELGLDDSEIGQLMPTVPENWVFEKTTVTDEDSKKSWEYTNPLGQKVATYTAPGTMEGAVTLYLYDSQGNLSQVINPEKQPSFYRHNLLGWLYEKETVDGGKTQYLYNRAGQVVLEQDANGEVGSPHPTVTDGQGDPVSRKYYRQYSYDRFGRTVRQERCLIDSMPGRMGVPFDFDVLHYRDLERGVTHIGYGQPPDEEEDTLVVMPFTHNSTYAWKAQVEDRDLNNLPRFRSVLDFLGRHLLEKRWFYGAQFDTTGAGLPVPGTGMASATYHPNSLWWLKHDRKGMRGQLSHSLTYDHDPWADAGQQLPVEAVFHSYNPDGELQWQLKQFSPNKLRPEAKGLV